MIQKSIFEITEKDDQFFFENNYLGPKSPFMGYSAYISSYHWRKKRKYALEKLGAQCQRCSATDKPLQLHHKHYETLYYEKLEDVAVLCEGCHEIADEKRRQSNIEKRYDSAFDTWATRKYGEEYYEMDEMMLNEEFEEWLEWKEQEDYY